MSLNQVLRAALAVLWPVIALVAGASMVMLMLGFGALPGVREAYPNGDHISAVLQFQMAFNGAGLERVFGAPADALKLAAADAINRADLSVFIRAYALFFVALARSLAGSFKERGAQIATGAILLAALADALETMTQIDIVAALQGGASYASLDADALRVSLSACVKFALIAVAQIACVVLIIRRFRRPAATSAAA